MVELLQYLVELGPSLLGCVVAWWFIERRPKRRAARRLRDGREVPMQPAKKALPKKCSHPESALVDIRSDVFSPKELVATLCTVCDEQLGPEVWQKILDRELAALDEPAAPVGTQSRSLKEYVDDGWRPVVEASKQITLRNPGKCEVTIYFDDRDHLKAFTAGEELGIEGPVEHSKKCDLSCTPAKPAKNLNDLPRSKEWSEYKTDGYRSNGHGRRADGEYQVLLQHKKHGCVVTLLAGGPNSADGFFEWGEQLFLESHDHTVKCPKYRKPREPKTSSTAAYLPLELSVDTLKKGIYGALDDLQQKIESDRQVLLERLEPQPGWRFSNFVEAGWLLDDVTTMGHDMMGGLYTLHWKSRDGSRFCKVPVRESILDEWMDS